MTDTEATRARWSGTGDNYCAAVPPVIAVIYGVSKNARDEMSQLPDEREAAASALPESGHPILLTGQRQDHGSLGLTAVSGHNRNTSIDRRGVGRRLIRRVGSWCWEQTPGTPTTPDEGETRDASQPDRIR